MTPSDVLASLRQLRKYQDHLLVAARRERALDQIAETLGGLEAASAALRTALAETEQQLTQTNQETTATHAHIAELHASMAARETRAASIKTNKEYQAAMKEIADGKQRVKQLELRATELELQQLTLTEKKTQLSAQVADIDSAQATQRTQLAADAEQMRQEREVSLAAAAQEEALVERSLMEKYRFVQRRHPNALSVVKGQSCGACNMKVAAQLLVDMRKGVRLISCQACARILCWDEGA